MIPSFPHRMVAVIARIVLAIVEDLPAAVADIACLVAAVVSLWLLHRLIVHTAAWVGRHVGRDALDREYAALCESFGGDGPAGAERLPGPTRLGPTVPLPVRELKRRTRARSIRRRLTRRHSTTSTSSDRRTR